jgi:hypothetical protein
MLRFCHKFQTKGIYAKSVKAKKKLEEHWDSIGHPIV